jgi:hypothetical protein
MSVSRWLRVSQLYERTWNFLESLLWHIKVTPEVYGCLLHRAKTEQVRLARVKAVLIGQEAVCVYFGVDGDVALYGADTGDVEAQFAIVGCKEDVEQVGAETAVLLTLSERLGEKLAFGGGKGGESEERWY